jgi:hypothetical protein
LGGAAAAAGAAPPEALPAWARSSRISSCSRCASRSVTAAWRVSWARGGGAARDTALRPHLGARVADEHLVRQRSLCGRARVRAVSPRRRERAVGSSVAVLQRALAAQLRARKLQRVPSRGAGAAQHDDTAPGARRRNAARSLAARARAGPASLR